MYKRLLVLLLLVFVPQAHAEQPAKLKIGFIVPFTGPLAQFGNAIQNGVTLAAEQNPKLKEVFKPYYEDSRYDPRTSVDNFHKLRSVDKVDAVYVFGGPISDTLAPIAERSALPMFSTEYDVRYTKGKKYVIRFANNASDYAGVLLAELRKRNVKRLGIVKVENQYHNTLSQALIDSLSGGESAKLIHNFQPGENDFRAAIAKLRLEKFDALGIYLTPGMQHIFLSQLKPSGLQFPLLGTDTFESREENRGVEDVVEGALFANSAVSPEFFKRYKKRFNSTAQVVHAALAYEFSLLVADLFEDRSRPKTADEFIAPFALSKGRQSVCGEYFYRNTPETGQYFSFPIAVRSLKAGEPEILRISKAP